MLGSMQEKQNEAFTNSLCSSSPLLIWNVWSGSLVWVRVIAYELVRSVAGRVASPRRPLIIAMSFLCSYRKTFSWHFEKHMSLVIKQRKNCQPFLQICQPFVRQTAESLNFAKMKAIMYFAKFLNAFLKLRNLIFFREINYILESPDHPLQNDIWYVHVLRVEIFSNFRLFRENCS